MKQNQKAKSRQFIYLESTAEQNLAALIQNLPPALGSDIILHQNNRTERQLMPLGETRQGLIYDIRAGFHPDTFAALAGCIAEHGWIILAGPPLSKLHLFQDPNYDKISSWPRICPAQTGYLKLLQQSLLQLVSAGSLQLKNKQTELLQLLQSLCMRARNQIEINNVQMNSTLEQQYIINRVLQGHVWGTLFANRGFGKTTCFKLLMQALSQAESPYAEIIYITERIHNRNLLAQWAKKINLKIRTATLSGMQSWQPGPALILIDECAAYNIALLEKSLLHFDQPDISVLLATSLDGYEGSARNLHKLQSPRILQHFHLTKALRWRPEDTLDMWIKSFFHAETMNTQALDQLQMPKPESICISRFKPEFEGNHSEKLQQQISQWMSLMSLAHYRTRPSDIRLMLDAPKQYFWQITGHEEIIAGLWISLEGPITEYLHQPILDRKRRVKGHLAPQYLAINGKPEALSQQWVRIVRIAVKPRYQQQGFGRQLFQTCISAFPQHSFTVSFKDDEKVKAFWQSVGFEEFRTGFYIKQ